MAMIFVNSLLYIWPISFLIYGEAAALPITAIVAWDASVAFGFFIISLEMMTGKSSNPARAIIRNPVLIAIILGTIASLTQFETPTPALTFMEFTGAAAAPLTLFALGVILSKNPIKPTACVATFAGIKLLIFPATLTLMLTFFGVRTDAIAQVIIWTSVLSLFSLAYLA